MTYTDVKEKEGPSVKYTLSLPPNDAHLLSMVAKKRRCKPQTIIREIIGNAIEEGLVS